jgi:hypothetical protein
MSEEIMSKKFLQMAILFFTIFILHQMTFGQFQNLQFGIKGGLNLAETDEDAAAIETVPGVGFEKKLYPAYNIGAFVEYPLNQKFSIQLGALYNVKGVKFQGAQVEYLIGLIDYFITEKLAYLSFPLLAKFSFGGAQAKPYVFVGPETSYLLSADVDVIADAMVLAGVEFDTTMEVTDELESLELGLNAGLGIEFPVRSFNAFFEASYGFGLTNVNNLEGADDFKNRMIYLNLGIKF